MKKGLIVFLTCVTFLVLVSVRMIEPGDWNAHGLMEAFDFLALFVLFGLFYALFRTYWLFVNAAVRLPCRACHRVGPACKCRVAATH